MSVKPFKSREDQEWDACCQEAKEHLADLIASDSLVGVYTITVYREGDNLTIDRSMDYGYIEPFLVEALVTGIVERVMADE